MRSARWSDVRRSVMVAAEEPSGRIEDVIRPHPCGKGVLTDLTWDEGKNFSVLLVGTEWAQGAGEIAVDEMREEGMDGGSPRAGGTPDSVTNAMHRRLIPASERLFHLQEENSLHPRRPA